MMFIVQLSHQASPEAWELGLPLGSPGPEILVGSGAMSHLGRVPLWRSRTCGERSRDVPNLPSPTPSCDKKQTEASVEPSGKNERESEGEVCVYVERDQHLASPKPERG